MQVIIMSALVVFLPLIIIGCVASWREHQYKKKTNTTSRKPLNTTKLCQGVVYVVNGNAKVIRHFSSCPQSLKSGIV